MEPAIVDSNVNETTENNHHTHSDHGWQKVTYTKRQRKTKPADPEKLRPNGAVANGEKTNVFRSLEQQAEDRRRRIVEAQQAALENDAPVRSKHRSDDEVDDDSDAEVAATGNAKTEQPKKVKQKKPKKPKVSVSEAAAKIDAADLSAFLVDISVCVV